jgi:WD40 repeat protein
MKTVLLQYGVLLQGKPFVLKYFIIDVFEAHTKAITQIYFIEEIRLLVTGAKDKSVKYWRLPERWLPKEIENFEEDEAKVKIYLI